MHSWNHPGKPECLAFSPDSKTLATAGEDHAVYLWRIDTGKKTHSLVGHRSSVKSMAWSPDGNTLASGSIDRTVRLWDIEKGAEKLIFDRHQAAVLSVAFSPDGKRIASAGNDEEYKLMGGGDKVRIWDTETGKETLADDDHVGWVAGLVVLDKAKTLVTSGADSKIRLWDLATGACTSQFLATIRARGPLLFLRTANCLLRVQMTGRCNCMSCRKVRWRSSSALTKQQSKVSVFHRTTSC